MVSVYRTGRSKARNLRWTVCAVGLAAVALPFLVAIGGGCGFQSQAFDDNVPNSYVCGCTCGPAARNLSVQVSASEDDAEQHLNDNSVEIPSPDLDMVSGRVVGIRFRDVEIPKNSTIMSAKIQFTASAIASANAVTFKIDGEASDNAVVFAATKNNITARVATAHSVTWTPGNWNASDTGPDQLTSDFSAVVQDIVDRAGWTNGNALVLRISVASGTAVRHALSEDGNSAKAPRLIVAFTEPTPGMVSLDLPVCVPPALDPNLMGGHAPTTDEIAADCTDRVQKTFSDLSAACSYPSQCTCTVQDKSERFSATCDNPCAANPVDAKCSNFDPVNNNVTATNAGMDDPVCLTGSPLAAEIFGQRTTCNVDGKAHVTVSGEDTKNPAAAGIVQFVGRPCPGQSCAVGMQYRLDIDNVTFGNFFHSETFHDLAGLGETADGDDATLSNVGQGTFAANTAAISAQGARGDERKSLVTMNDDPVDVDVLWGTMSPSCAVHGTLLGAVDPEAMKCVGGPDNGKFCSNNDDCTDDTSCTDGHCDCKKLGDSDLVLALDVEGDIVNQPPTADAGMPQTVECSKSGVTGVTLDGSNSSDLDDNIVLYSWLRHDRAGDEVGFQPTTKVQQQLGTESYVLRVIDAFGQADEDTTTVKVADTTPPVVHCAVTKSLFTDNNHNLINVGLSASAQDQCEGPLPISVTVYSNEDDQDLSEYNPGQDPNHFAHRFSPDAKNIGLGSLRLRSERNGNNDGRVYLIVTEATDSSGNVGVDCCTVRVPLYPGTPSLQAVTNEATAAADFCRDSTGAAPPGYSIVGDGPILGTKQ